MNVEASNLAAILAMATATYFTRAGGFLLMRGVRAEGRIKVALDALPPAILMAVIAPTVITTGTAETIAAAIAAVAASLRLPLILVVLIGVMSVTILRATIG